MSLLVNTIGTLMMIYSGTWGVEMLFDRYADVQAGAPETNQERPHTRPTDASSDSIQVEHR